MNEEETKWEMCKVCKTVISLALHSGVWIRPDTFVCISCSKVIAVSLIEGHIK